MCLTNNESIMQQIRHEIAYNFFDYNKISVFCGKEKYCFTTEDRHLFMYENNLNELKELDQYKFLTYLNSIISGRNIIKVISKTEFKNSSKTLELEIQLT